MTSADHLYVGTTEGRVCRIDWTGNAWSVAANPSSPFHAIVSDLLIDPGNPARLWATSSQTGNVSRSDDAAASWHDFSPNLKGMPVNAVAVDDRNPRRVWIGTDMGVYQSLDAGKTWAPYSKGLPRLIVGDLAFQSTARLLRAATRDRGVWEIAVG